MIRLTSFSPGTCEAYQCQIRNDVCVSVVNYIVFLQYQCYKLKQAKDFLSFLK